MYEPLSVEIHHPHPVEDGDFVNFATKTSDAWKWNMQWGSSTYQLAVEQGS
jgi:hypothetical protein